MGFAPQRRALFQHGNLQKWREHVVFCTFWLRNVLRGTTACTFSTSQLPKVVRSWCVLYILTSKCASRHNGVHFLDISTSKSGPRMVCFVHFHFEMCFAPQRRALFRHLNFQKWSGAGVFCTFWLGNVLRATTARTFSTLQLPKVVRRWGVLYIFTWKCASRHNGVHFFISHLASWLRTRRFSEPTFRPSGATNHWKNTVFRDFPTFSRICIFFLLTLSLLSASALLCFSSVHIVGSLTSKLPSIIVSKVVNHNPINAINPPTTYHFDGWDKTTIIIIWVFHYRFTNIIPPTLIFTTPANSWFQPTRRMGPWLSNGLHWCFWWQTWGQFQFKVNIVWTYFSRLVEHLI